MKGIELPINILIIVAIAVIVLIAVIAMFYPAFNSGSSTVGLETAKTQACRSLVVGLKCNTTIALNTIRVDNYDVNGNGFVNEAADNLDNLCDLKYQTASDSDCRKMCNCAS